ncbi:TAXI family TRAP transporter solute-binding subunit [uncultured Sphaerochaeta sp.]|uniref:TAXI family TRAP transporter solute-binding subunit n=1 Tax=uncultured Sphaerochaeta sp. TaxID=886478 RepID=UPI0029CA088F|nr:TAXI family TRAP transporter solute-binding subunit [uncultured Sphaerochaeta sp.]
MNLMKKCLMISLISIMALSFGFAQGEKEASGAARPAFISIGTASAAGAYYPIGVALADVWNKTLPGTRFSSQETGGSVANLNMIASGELEMGMSNENVAYTAGLGQDPFKNPIDLKGGWILNNSNAIIVAMGDSGITSVSQLKGKKVSLGAPGSSANVFGELILASEGLEKGDYEQVFMGWQESADAMNDGFIDAALMVGGQPFPAVTSLSVRSDVQVLTFNTKRFRELSSYPYATDKIPADMYDMKQDGDSVIIRSVVYISPDLSDEIVYDMVKQVFENIPTLVSAHPSASGTRLFSEEAAKDISLEIHPGVIRYATEVGEW